MARTTVTTAMLTDQAVTTAKIADLGVSTGKLAANAVTAAKLDTALLNNALCQGRLTLTTVTPVTTADVTAAETVYFTPYKGNRIALYDGSAWATYAFSEVSVDVPDATQMNDVFIYNNSGTLTLEVLAWSNVTTRATALVLQDGVLVKSGATTRRYLGSFYSTTAGNGQTEDSFANRYLWNYYNRTLRPMRVLEATDTWAYTTATIRQANGSTANQLNFCIGVSEDAVKADIYASALNNTGATFTAVGVGLDVTDAFTSGGVFGGLQTSTVEQHMVASWRGFPGIGKHFLSWNEWSEANGTTTWRGDNGTPTLDQSGIHGELLA